MRLLRYFVSQIPYLYAAVDEKRFCNDQNLKSPGTVISQYIHSKRGFYLCSHLESDLKLYCAEFDTVLTNFTVL